MQKLKKTHILFPKQKYIQDYVSKLKEKPGPHENPALLIWNAIDIVKIGLDEYVRYNGELIPVYEFFERKEIETTKEVG